MKGTEYKYEGLTDGVRKSVESACMVLGPGPAVRYVLKYKGKAIHESPKLKLFINAGGAKVWAATVVKLMFWQGEYWQSCKSNIKKRQGYDVDFSSTIEILPQYCLTSRFDKPENKAMFKKIASDLFKSGDFTIEKIEI